MWQFSARPGSLALAQDRTEAALRDAFVAFGGAARYGTEFTGLRQEAGRVIVETWDGAQGEYAT